MSIICATDFSPSSEAATQLAGALARRLGDSLVLVHAVEPLVVPLPYAGSGSAAMEMGIKDAADALMDGTIKRLQAAGLTAEGRVIFGMAASTLCELTRATGPRLLVMGTHGRKGAARLLGSVAANVAAHASCPVLVTRSERIDLEPWRGDAPLRLMVGVDGTRASRSAFAWAGHFGRATPCNLEVTRLYWPGQEALRYGLEQPSPGEDGHPELLRLLQRDLRAQGLADPALAEAAVHFRTAHVNAAEVLVDQAQATRATALVIGVPRHGIEAWSAIVPSAVLRSASVPVFCVPAGTQATARAPLPDLRSVLVATDLSQTSNDAVVRAYGLLRPGGGRVELCHVHERVHQASVVSPASWQEPLTPEQTAATTAQLGALVPPDAEARGIVTKVSVLEGATVAGTILKAARRLNVDVIAVASHGRSGLKRALLGSVAEEVARHADRPVFVVHLPPR